MNTQLIHFYYKIIDGFIQFFRGQNDALLTKKEDKHTKYMIKRTSAQYKIVDFEKKC